MVSEAHMGRHPGPVRPGPSFNRARDNVGKCEWGSLNRARRNAYMREWRKRTGDWASSRRTPPGSRRTTSAGGPWHRLHQAIYTPGSANPPHLEGAGDELAGIFLLHAPQQPQVEQHVPQLALLHCSAVVLVVPREQLLVQGAHARAGLHGHTCALGSLAPAHVQKQTHTHCVRSAPPLLGPGDQCPVPRHPGDQCRNTATRQGQGRAKGVTRGGTLRGKGAHQRGHTKGGTSSSTRTGQGEPQQQVRDQFKHKA